MENIGRSGPGLHGWQKIFTTITGWRPEMEYLPAIPAACTLYLSIFIFGLVLHNITKLVVPSFLRGFVLDFVKTMTLCGYPFGHGIMRKYYGEVGYVSAMVPMVFLTLTTQRDGFGNPIAVWLQYFKKVMPLWICLVKNLIQLSAGISAYHLGMYILNLELHEAYVNRLKNYYEQFCETDLHVPVHVGFLIEFAAVVYDSWFQCVHLTGMYVHPAMATGHTWGCGDTSKFTHILIYWIGPMAGSWLSVQIQKKIYIRRPGTGKQTQTKPRVKNGTKTGLAMKVQENGD
ncbi:AQP11-like protein, partial [Mya arenaria]